MTTRKIKEETTTAIVERVLRLADDFIGMPELVRATGRSTHQVEVALYYLRRRKVVDSVENGERLYWFILPPEMDDRCKTCAERVPESKPRGNYKKRAKKGSTSA